MKHIILTLCLVFLLVPTVSAVTWVGEDAPAQTDFDIYFNSSNTDTISYNLTEGGLTTVDYWFIPDIKIIFGGFFE